MAHIPHTRSQTEASSKYTRRVYITDETEDACQEEHWKQLRFLVIVSTFKLYLITLIAPQRLFNIAGQNCPLRMSADKVTEQFKWTFTKRFSIRHSDYSLLIEVLIKPTTTRVVSFVNRLPANGLLYSWTATVARTLQPRCSETAACQCEIKR